MSTLKNKRSSPMGHVFISYNQNDSDFAENLQGRLEQANLKVWWDDKLRGGENWHQEIDEAIKNAVALIIVMTPEAKASEYVTYEWAFASGTGIKIIPVLLKQTTLHPRLADLQHLDFTNRKARPWDRLINLLTEINAYKRMMSLLREEGYEWRSVGRLATQGNVSRKVALEILKRDPNVEFGSSSTLGRLARLIEK